MTSPARRVERLRTLARLDRSERARLLQETLRTLPRDSVSCSSDLTELRAVLREPLPLWPARATDPVVAWSLSVSSVDERRFCVSGEWSAPGPGWSARAVSPEGEAIALETTTPRSGTRFVELIELTCPSTVSNGWLLEVDFEGNAVGELPFPPVEHGADAVRRALADAGVSDRGEKALAAARSWRRGVDARTPVATVSFGRRPAHARVAVLVEVEGVADMEQHLAGALSGELPSDAALVYLVRDGGPPERVLDVAGDLHALYDVSFEVVVLAPGSPFAPARAEPSQRFEVLVLLSGDLVPVGESWLPDLLEGFGASSPPGAVTPKLLNLDGAIVSAGWDIDCSGGLVPRLQGRPARDPASGTSARVAAAGPGCVVVSAATYQQAVSDGPTFLGDEFEAFDLSLRLAAQERENRYVPVELLVAPARPIGPPTAVGQFDAALFRECWPNLATVTPPAEGLKPPVPVLS